MPMWMSWLNLQTDKTERIYNYHDPDTPEGQSQLRKLPSRTPSAPGRSPSLTGRSEECT